MPVRSGPGAKSDHALDGVDQLLAFERLGKKTGGPALFQSFLRKRPVAASEKDERNSNQLSPVLHPCAQFEVPGSLDAEKDDVGHVCFDHAQPLVQTVRQVNRYDRPFKHVADQSQ